jgi:F-type H+-transporting ATPase subunit a
MAATSLHISLSAEPVLQLGGLILTNSMITSVIVSVLLIVFAVIVNLSLTQTSKPTGLQNLAEWMIESLYSLVHSITGDLKKTSLFFPLIATFFLFILFNNWIGLLPGVGSISVTPRVAHAETATTEHTTTEAAESLTHSESTLVESTDHDTVVTDQGTGEHTAVTMDDEHTDTPLATNTETHETPAAEHAETGHSSTVHLFRAGTADLNTTIALGLISVVLTQYFGFKFLSLGYFSKFFNFSSPIMFFVGLLELISEVGKILSFGFRLFGNVFAGEVLLAVITYLAGVAVPIPFYGLEVFVGFIQALVFAMLSLVFINMATLGHGEEH